MTSPRLYRHIDWLPVICWLFIAIFGWLNIYASIYSDELVSIFSMDTKSGNQFLWMMIGLVTAVLLILVIPPRFYMGLTWPLYIFTIALLVLVLVVGKEVNGAKAWLAVGPFSLQPSEISKITTALALSSVMDHYDFSFKNRRDLLKVAGVMLLPIALILMEPDMGTILVYCSFFVMFYREGMTGWILLFVVLEILLFVLTLKFSPLVALLTLVGLMGAIYAAYSRYSLRNAVFFILFIIFGAFLPRLYELESLSFLNLFEPVVWVLFLTVPFLIFLLVAGDWKRYRFRRFIALAYVLSSLFIFSVQKIFNDVLQPHHRDRIENILGITEDLKGAGYNVHQSEIAIGSGGFFGKGYLEGTQTKFNFVPEQSTDFIFCTIGEEWGFLGSLAVLAAYLAIIISIVSSAERQQDVRYRIYGYSIACIFFTHVFVNVGMTMGIVPVIGIPLPFISYGGSSFLSFTVMLFIYLRLDLERWK